MHSSSVLPFSGNLQIERGDRAYVRDYVNESDQEAILESIRDAARRSDVVIGYIAYA